MEEVFAGDIFFLLHNIGKNQFYRLKQQYLSDGVEARVHGLTKKSPRHSLKYDDVQRMVQFIANYAETHAIITLPGRTPHHWKADALLLPTSTTKRVVYDEYKKVNFNLSFDLCIVFSQLSILLIFIYSTNEKRIPEPYNYFYYNIYDGTFLTFLL